MPSIESVQVRVENAAVPETCPPDRAKLVQKHREARTLSCLENEMQIHGCCDNIGDRSWIVSPWLRLSRSSTFPDMKVNIQTTVVLDAVNR